MMGVLLSFMTMPMDTAQAAEEIASVVKIAETDNLGRYLTDKSGMTLYYFTKDSKDMSTCSGFCLERWPIFSAEIRSVPMGLDAGDFGTIKRTDGKVQTTYKGQPLYYFISDNNPGDTNGQGVYNSWYVVAP